MKLGFLTSTGVVGGTITSFFGGWSSALTTLIMFMLADYISGILLAGVFKNSPKSKDGGLDSKVGAKGLCKKIGILVLVSISYRIDLILGTDYIKECVIFGFIANETLSITENIGLMGVPLPNIIKKAISILNERCDKNELQG